MPTKRKNTHDLKQAADPLGILILPFYHIKNIPCIFFFVLDDILRKNLFLSKHARPVDQQPKPLGKC